ncbi:hypothetical protein GOODEAATRI_025747, partial [Goodea atripinnis]
GFSSLFGSDFGSQAYAAMHTETCRSGPGIKPNITLLSVAACVLKGDTAAAAACLTIPISNNCNASSVLRCHIYDNQSIIHLLGLPLPCVDPTAMLPAHIWLRGAPLSPGWDLPPVMGHLGGQMKPRLDEGFVYYGYGALWRH